MGKSNDNFLKVSKIYEKIKLVNKNGSKSGDHITVINENHVEHRPMCIHGPTLLFKKTFDNGTEPIEFYACSAFRNPKECPILTDEHVALNRAHLHAQSKSILGLAEIAKESPKKRAYCHTCSCLFTTSEKRIHQHHDFLSGISDELLSQPTRFLRPLSRDTKEAQYFFADSTLQCIVNIFKQLDIRFFDILCTDSEELTHSMRSLSSLKYHLEDEFVFRKINRKAALSLENEVMDE